MLSAFRRCGSVPWPSFRRVSPSSMLQRAECRSPFVKTVIQASYAFQARPLLQGTADLSNPFHSRGVPGDSELIQRFLTTGACGVRIIAGGLSGRKVAE